MTKRQVLKHTVKFREEAKGGKNRTFEGKETKQEQAEEIAQQNSTRPDFGLCGTMPSFGWRAENKGIVLFC